MNSTWFKVYLASFFEVLWVIGLKHADDTITWIGTIISIVLSFYLLIISGRKLPVGTVYAVFVGLGTVGIVLAIFSFFGEPLKMKKLFFILLLLIGVMGLKLVTAEQKSERKDL